jgi:hypothetical protein
MGSKPLSHPETSGGHTFIFGFTVYENFEGNKVARTGVLDVPRRKKTVCSSAMPCWRWATKRFLMHNSWGTGWGRKGSFTMPFDCLLDGDLAEDFWTVRSVS